MAQKDCVRNSKLEFEVGQTVHGFEVVDRDPVPEIDTVAYLMKHVATGARLLYLQNSDNNKTFSIAFKTPPANDTGVFHILEHSVLCGSDAYPVKEPFVDLLKCSMQTFLNAMTYPDKTVYPVASTNERDLENLASIYIDAVLNPALRNDPQILQQEGWHYEVADDEERTLSTNGVVYSEMKGALSDPDSIAELTLVRALFPDTPYGFESGGEPISIPNLTQEEFVDTYNRHYRLDNSYTLLYGNMDIEHFLEFLDEKYSKARPAGVSGPNPLPLQAPVKELGIRREMSTAPENACVMQGYVVGTAGDIEKVSAVQLAISALMGSNEAPLKHAILDSGIASSASATVLTEFQQPFLVLQINGLKADDAEARLRQIVCEECQRIVDEGFDQELLEASLSRIEFIYREGNLSCRDGVGYACGTLSTWLYDDSQSTTILHYERLIDTLRTWIDDGSGYYEQLLREVVLENPHMATVEIVPVDTDPTEWETRKMSDLRATLDGEALDKIAIDARKLKEKQEAPDSPEAKATIPMLHLCDVGDAPVEPSCEYEEDKRCIVHHVDTRGIVYVSRFFDLGCVSFDELPYLPLLAKLLGCVDTDRHSAADLVTLVKRELGNLYFSIKTFENIDDVAHPRLFLEVNASALSHKLDKLVDISNEVMLLSHLDDKVRLRKFVEQGKVNMEQLLVSGPITVANTRMGSMFRPAAVIDDVLGGIEGYRFVKELLANFDEMYPQVIAKVQELATRIFSSQNSIFSFAGSNEDYDRFMSFDHGIAKAGGSTPVDFDKLKVHTGTPHNEAFVIPTNVAFVTAGNDCIPFGRQYKGSNPVACGPLNLDYLWNEVRVKGGAYGAGGNLPRSLMARFYSYRDPHIDETLDIFKNAGSWLSANEPDAESLEGYKISVLSGNDAPIKPRVLVSKQNARYFSGIPADEKERYRRETVDATVDDVHEMGDLFTKAMAGSVSCTFASAEMLSKSKVDFETIDLFSE